MARLPLPSGRDLELLRAMAVVDRSDPSQLQVVIAKELGITIEEANQRLDEFVAGFCAAFLAADVESDPHLHGELGRAFLREFRDD